MDRMHRVANEGQDLGELREAAILAQWKAGMLGASAHYYYKEAAEWRPLGELVEAIQKFASSESAKPPAIPVTRESIVGSAAIAPVVPAKRYTSPILATLFSIIGALVLAFGVLVVIGAFGTDLPKTSPGGALGVAIGAVVLFGIQGIVLIGVGQVIDYIGRIAHETTRTADLLAQAAHWRR